MNKCIVLGVKSYQFENDKQEKIEGVKVSYLLQEKTKKQNEQGYLPLQSVLSYEKLNSFVEVPGVYDLNFSMVPGKNNKPVMEITDFKFVKGVQLHESFK